MARYTSAYSEFVSRLDEVETLRQSAATKERKAPIELRGEINALSRGAIVLLSGHMEAYIRELGELALDSMTSKNVFRSQLTSRIYYHISKDILDEIRDTSDPEKIADKIFQFIDSDIEYWSKNGTFPQPIPVGRFNKGFNNPAYKKIVKYFNRFGYDSYRHDLVTRLRANFDPTVNMVDQLVDIRNKIAHGDPNASKTPGEVKAMMSIVRSFCRVTDTVFATWWKNHYCGIR